MFPGPTEMRFIGCSIESIWTPRSKSNTLTPKTNSQTYWPREISHVMNEIIFCVCLTLAISVLPMVPNRCRKERKKIQVKKESQQNRSRWWIWSRDAANGLLMCYLQLHQKAWGKPDMKVKYLWARGLSSIMEQGDLLYTLTHQATQSGMLTRIGPASFALDHSPCARMIWIFNDMSDSKTVLGSISSSSTINLSVCFVKPGGCSLTGLPVLTSIN